MLPELSRRAGRIMSKANIPPSWEERSRINTAMEEVDTWEELPDDVLSILEKLQDPSRSYLELRHMPGKHDQSTHGHGGHGGYESGKWTKSNGDEAQTKLIKDSLLEEMPASMQAAQAEKNGPQWLDKMAERLTLRGGPPSTMYRNGEHLIWFKTDKVDEKSQKQFLKDFDHYQTKYPTGHPMAITIEGKGEFGNMVGGETTLNTGSMRLNEAVFESGRKWNSGMPSQASVPASKYVLAHEWGHSLSTKEQADNRTVHRKAIDSGELSRYGTAGVTGVLAPREGYAEAFAEWSLTNGKTTNAAAKAYADEFGWGEKFDVN